MPGLCSVMAIRRRVMAGLGPATHDFACGTQASRGWSAFAGHDTAKYVP
jgi:hypothetical protein